MADEQQGCLGHCSVCVCHRERERDCVCVRERLCARECVREREPWARE